MQFVITFGLGLDAQVVACQQGDIARTGHVAAAHGEIIAGGQVNGVAVQLTALHRLAVNLVAGGRGGFRQEAVTAHHFMPFVQILRILARRQGQVIPGADVQRLASGEGGGAGVEIVPGGQSDVTFARHFAADAVGLPLFQAVIAIPHQIIAAGGFHRIQGHIPPGHQLRFAVLAAGDHLRPGQGDIPPGLQR